ncbi:uncharacterized protein PGTG_19012 [Puccinia graminis f. sp. tritici CRL 75-36-700-3]|uniref:Uncharacterized protein n=1 Tax=Puccinia graminis f. sp. tritici (strain CRL 75-36-700-3 / race SCCL) TaxID=418459 RepID=E3L8X4_PUCGT|nr:uncharacterized protein PGTG_19012 [Puccinia graminis f. sp. tritici CRL 75-36-700-3]EFP92999.1 hypothetical protein PGTG_19012 [Puccinia graminis f. sp. tritici CRL 75-36-700-3]
MSDTDSDSEGHLDGLLSRHKGKGKGTSRMAGSEDDSSHQGSGSERDDPGLDFMDSLFQDSTTPPLVEEPDRNPTENNNQQAAGIQQEDLSQRFAEFAIPQEAQPSSTSLSRSLWGIFGFSTDRLEEQTELERALNEANARRDFFNASDPFHLHLRSPSKDFLIDHPIMAGALDQEHSASVGVQASLSGLIGPRPRDPHQASADPDRPDGAAVGGAVDIAAPAAHAKPFNIPVAAAGSSTDHPVPGGHSGGDNPPDVTVPTNVPSDVARCTSADTPGTAGPSADNPPPPPAEKSPVDEKIDTKPSRGDKTSSQWLGLIEVESDPEDETYLPVGKNKMKKSSDSDSELFFSLLPSEPERLNPVAGNEDQPATERLSYHALSLRNAALEDYMKELMSKTEQRIHHLNEKVNRLKRTSAQKSNAARKLKNRLKAKDKKLSELVRARQVELHAIKLLLDAATESDLHRQLRSLLDQLAQRKALIAQLQKESLLHSVLRFDLQTHRQKLESKLHQLESNPSSLINRS